MSRIALTRLLVANDRSARRRLAGIVAGVMVGVTLFLMLLAAAQAQAAAATLATIRAAGYPLAAIVGRVEEGAGITVA